MELKGKTILILPSQSWGKMFISKHHYAITLAERGNTVYYLNPPDNKLNESIVIEQSTFNNNLYIVSHKLWFPYNIKFHLLGVFHHLMGTEIKRLTKIIGQPDIVWSFDLENVYPFKYFGQNSLKIFHPVDEPLTKNAISAANGANIIFSVTKEILQKYQHLKTPSYFINHGVADNFLLQNCGDGQQKRKVKIGISGNFLRKDIDRDTMIKIIEENTAIEFHLWGTYEIKDSNIGGTDDSCQKNFIQKLKSLENTIFYGAVSANELAAAYCQMDGFLICYDVEKDQSKGTNYHKIMEYLAYGKVIIANNVSTYKDEPDLITMCKSRSSNTEMIALFKSVVSDLATYNSPYLISKRKAFAKNNGYHKQVDRIESLLGQAT